MVSSENDGGMDTAAEKNLNQITSSDAYNERTGESDGNFPDKQLNSVVQLVQRDNPSVDAQHSLSDNSRRNNGKGEASKLDEGGSATPDGGVPKRCLSEGLQDAESPGGKTKKKKHKRLDIVSSTSISVKVTSSSSVVAETETRTKNKHKKSKKSRSREEFFQSLVESGKNGKKEMEDNGAQSGKTETVALQNRPVPSFSRYGEDSKRDSHFSGEARKKPIVLSKILKRNSSAQLTDPSRSPSSSNVGVGRPATKSDSPVKKMTGLKSEVLKLMSQHPPSLPPPLQESDTCEDEEDLNNNEHTSQSAARTTAASSFKKKKSSTLQRSSSTSSISSTSTTTSTASSVASSTGSFTYRKSSSHKKTKKKTVVTFKTAKHLHKSKKSKDVGGGGDSGHADKESKKHSAEISDRTQKTGRGRKGQDTAVILSHIRKAFASSESELDGSPIKLALASDQQMKSLAWKMKECAKTLADVTAAVVEDRNAKVEDVKTSFTKHPSTGHVYQKPVNRDTSSVDNDGLKQEGSEKKSTGAPKHLDAHNTTYMYQLTEEKPSVPPAATSSYTSKEKKISTQGGLPLPKQLAYTSANSSERKAETSASQTVTDYKKVVGNPAADYDVDPGELTSSSDDESWKKMVNEITKEHSDDAHWSYKVDSQRQRLCVEGTTYATPPIPWRTNWFWHDGAMASSSPRPTFGAPTLPQPTFGAPTMPQPIRPPTVLQPPPPPVSSSSNSLYHQASQRMHTPSAIATASPFPWQNKTLPTQPPIASPWRPVPKPNEDTNWAIRTLQGPYRPHVAEDTNWRTKAPYDPYKSRADDTNWRIKKPDPYNIDNDSPDSCCDHSEYQETPSTQRTSYPPQQTSYTGYNQKSLPPRFARLEQEKQRAYTEYHTPNPSSLPQTSSSGYPASSPWVPAIATTPHQPSWSARKSLSPGTPSFEYDTSEVMYPYSMRDYIDTHCHIDFLYQRLGYKGTFQKFSQMHHFPPNYAGCVAVFCTPQSVAPYGIWNDLLKEDKIWGAFGIHPHHAKYYDARIEENIKHCMKHSKAVAYGEIGLDYSSRNDSDWILQQEVFRRQLRIALDMEKPLVIHSRDAEEDTIEIMASMVPKDYKIHRHCFTGTPEEAT